MVNASKILEHNIQVGGDSEFKIMYNERRQATEVYTGEPYDTDRVVYMMQDGELTEDEINTILYFVKLSYRQGLNHGAGKVQNIIKEALGID